MSVLIERIHLDAGETHQSAVSAPRWVGNGLARVEVQDLIDRAQRVEHDPTPDDYAHGLVHGTKSKKLRKELADLAEILIEPDSMV